jgi:hypothetical protein
MSRPTVLVAALALAVSGCLPAFPTDPTGSDSPASGASGGSGGTGGGGGTVTPPPTGQDAGVAGSGADMALPATADMALPAAADMANNCIKLTTPLTDGHHNAGDACLSCHDGGGGATLFTWAGTLYNAASGGATIAGATIEIIDAKGIVDRVVTSSNGNFYSSTVLTPPFSARASGCPNDTAMVSKATGNCNSSGCHTSAMRVHLP